MKKGMWVVCVVMVYAIVLPAMDRKKADSGDFVGAPANMGDAPQEDVVRHEEDPVRDLVKKAVTLSTEEFRESLLRCVEGGHDLNILTMDRRFGREMTPLDIVDAQLPLIRRSGSVNKSDLYSTMDYRLVRARVELVEYGALTRDELKSFRCDVS